MRRGARGSIHAAIWSLALMWLGGSATLPSRAALLLWLAGGRTDRRGRHDRSVCVPGKHRAGESILL